MPLLTLQHSIILVWSFTILKNGWWTGASEMEQAKYCSDEATWFLSFTTDFAFAGWSCQRSNSPDMALSHAQHQARKSSFYTLIYFQIFSAVMPFIMSWRIWLFFFFFLQMTTLRNLKVTKSYLDWKGHFQCSPIKWSLFNIKPQCSFRLNYNFQVLDSKTKSQL